MVPVLDQIKALIRPDGDGDHMVAEEFRTMSLGALAPFAARLPDFEHSDRDLGPRTSAIATGCRRGYRGVWPGYGNNGIVNAIAQIGKKRWRRQPKEIPYMVVDAGLLREMPRARFGASSSSGASKWIAFLKAYNDGSYRPVIADPFCHLGQNCIGMTPDIDKVMSLA
ncbi:hypothetical protein LJR030_002736 [Rhizobium sp. LjRoot30]